MDDNKALKKAATEGNTTKLDELVNENPMLLDKVMPLFSETPLHVSALAGHAEFVKLVLQRAPNLARQTNHEGLNPLHVAAASGHANVVSVLLDFDQELALVGDFKDSTPLHYAAYHGRVEVARLLLSKKPLLLESVNLEGETALHVALKNKQHHINHLFEQVVDKIGIKLGNQLLASAQDEYGHSIQFLVAPSSQTKYPTQTYAQASEVLQAHTKNLRQSRHGQKGDNHQMNSEVETITYQLFQKKSIAREAMLVIGILIATLTFQALLNPPQSIWKDGVANETRIKFYIFFLACNTVSFFASCIGIFAALKEDTDMLVFWVSSSLTSSAACYICALVSMMEKNVFPKVIIASLIIVIPNVIISLFLYSSKVKKVVQRLLQGHALF